MSTYIAVIFETEKTADAGLQKLWQMDTEGELTVHGAAIVQRDDLGDVQVSHKHTDAGMRTAVGVGLGALLGVFAGPVGVAAGIAGAAAVTVGAGLGVGAVAGAVVGGTADALKSADRSDMEHLSFFVLKHGQYAVVAEVSESLDSNLDNTMKTLGGTVHRRSNDDAFTGSYGHEYYGRYMYPYYYEPTSL